MKKLGATSLAFCVSLVFADTYQRQPGVDVQHYVFRVTVNDENDQIAGETTITLRFLRDGLTEFWLDLASPSNGKGMTVSEVISGGAAVRYTHQADHLTLAMAQPSKTCLLYTSDAAD